MRPSRDEMLMDITRVVATRSTCQRAQVGAVIAREGRILTMGYNGAPAGMDHCDHYPGEYSQSSGCTRAVHAEANAVAYAARYGIDVSNSVLFTTLSPCLSCSQLIVNSGVLRVVCLELYRDIIGVRLLTDAGLEVELVERDE